LDPIPSLLGPEGQGMIENHIKDAELIILDNLSTLTFGGKENEAESWLPVQQWVLSLRRRGVSVLLIHHAGRNGEQRGTSRREDILDTMITLQHPENYKTEEGARFKVHFTKARNIYGADAEPFEAQMRIENGASVWTIKEVDDSIVAAKELLDKMSVRKIEK